MADAIAGSVDPTSVTASGKRLHFLDAARGIAALAVALQHLCEERFDGFRHQTGIWFNFGVFGVTMFFLVSGFIIPAAMEKYSDPGRFWRGRILRLFPMYLLALALALILLRLEGGTFLATCRHPLFCVAANATMLEEFVGAPRVMGGAWTLGLELVFYASCSVAWWLGWMKRPVLMMTIAIGVVAAADLFGMLTHRSLPSGRIGLLATSFFGTLLYRIYRGQAERRWLWLLAPLILALLAGFWFRFHLYPVHEDATFTFACVSFSWAAAYALFFGLYAMRLRGFPRWMLWNGKVSYSFYLLAGILPAILPGAKYPWLWIGESLAVCLLLSSATYRWIERPIMLLGNQKRSEVRT